MNLGALIGLVSGLGILGAAAVIGSATSGGVGSLWDAISLAIVVGGAIAATCIAYPLPDVISALAGFPKVFSAQGFTLLIPSIITAITIVLCMFTLSLVMKVIPVGITYASFAGLCIVATVLVGIVKFNQIPNLYTIIGLGLIIAGVLMVNLIGKTNS